MPRLTVTALADQVRAHLEAGQFSGLDPVAFGLDDAGGDAAHAARIVLADVQHCAQLEEHGRAVPAERWDDLADQLRGLWAIAQAQGRGSG
jgi:hypothetical protein